MYLDGKFVSLLLIRMIFRRDLWWKKSYLQNDLIIVLHLQNVGRGHRGWRAILGQRSDSRVLISRGRWCRFPVSMAALPALLSRMIYVQHRRWMRPSPVLVPPLLSRSMLLLLRLRHRGHHFVEHLVGQFLHFTLLVLLLPPLLFLPHVTLDSRPLLPSPRPFPPEVAVLVTIHVVHQSLRALRSSRLTVLAPPAGAVGAIEERVRGRRRVIRSLVQGIDHHRVTARQPAAIHRLLDLPAPLIQSWTGLPDRVVSTRLQSVRLTVFAARLMSLFARIATIRHSVQGGRVKGLLLWKEGVSIHACFVGEEVGLIVGSRG